MVHTDLVHPKFMSQIVLRKVRRAKNSFEVFWLSHGSSTRIRSTIQYIQKMCFVLVATDGERWFFCRWPSLYKIINYRTKRQYWRNCLYFQDKSRQIFYKFKFTTFTTQNNPWVHKKNMLYCAADSLPIVKLIFRNFKAAIKLFVNKWRTKGRHTDTVKYLVG